MPRSIKGYYTSVSGFLDSFSEVMKLSIPLYLANNKIIEEND